MRGISVVLAFERNIDIRHGSEHVHDSPQYEPPSVILLQSHIYRHAFDTASEHFGLNCRKSVVPKYQWIWSSKSTDTAPDCSIIRRNFPLVDLWRSKRCREPA